MAALQERDDDTRCCQEPLSAAVEDYLKVLYHLTANNQAATVTGLAERLQVSAPSASAMVKRLAEAGYVVRGQERHIALTDHGERHALGVVRRHRLLETFLAETLGLSWDEVHAEAEVLEHAISDRLEDRIADVLGNPTVDPHGDPIPPKSGPHNEQWGPSLDAAPPGTWFTVDRVSDRDHRALQHLTECGIGLGTRLRILRKDAFGGPLWVEVDGQPCPLGPGLTGIVHGTVDEEPAEASP